MQRLRETPNTPGAEDSETAVEAAALMPLSAVRVGARVLVHTVRCGVTEIEGGDIGLRLLELGFVEGEPLRVIAHGYPGGEPIAVRIGNTTFALRRFEADHVLVVPAHAAGKLS
jgi:ferrous iron transport protein A